MPESESDKTDGNDEEAVATADTQPLDPNHDACDTGQESSSTDVSNTQQSQYPFSQTHPHLFYPEQHQSTLATTNTDQLSRKSSLTRPER